MRARMAVCVPGEGKMSQACLFVPVYDHDELALQVCASVLESECRQKAAHLTPPGLHPMAEASSEQVLDAALCRCLCEALTCGCPRQCLREICG
jgi:hypothetical protein